MSRPPDRRRRRRPGAFNPVDGSISVVAEVPHPQGRTLAVLSIPLTGPLALSRCSRAGRSGSGTSPFNPVAGSISVVAKRQERHGQPHHPLSIPLTGPLALSRVHSRGRATTRTSFNPVDGSISVVASSLECRRLRRTAFNPVDGSISVVARWRRARGPSPRRLSIPLTGPLALSPLHGARHRPAHRDCFQSR